MSNIYAFTAPGTVYPEYLSVNETDDPDAVSITVRSKPAESDGCYICGYARDKGQPGRCTPGDEHCNNYCNMAPEKGKMADAPLPCQHVSEGPQAIVTLSKAQMAELAAAIVAKA